MPRRPGLTRERVVDAAAELVDREGPTGLTLAALAGHFGVRTPSLYNHVDGLGGLIRDLRLRGMQELGTRLARATVGRSEGEALRELARAYRAYAVERPGLYDLVQRSAEGEGDAELEAAAGDVLEVIRAAMGGYGFEGDDALHAIRILRSALHGFVSLEGSGGFGMPLDREESFERLVALLHEALRRMRTAPAPETPVVRYA